MSDVAEALSNIAELLTVCEYGDRRKITALQNWSRVLSGTPSEQEALEVWRAVQSVIAGMNSLSDIYLQPPADSGLATSEANQELYRRIVLLDKLVRRQLGI